MNYYKHHIGDFIRDTSRLTDSQCMAYLRMLWMYYETEEPFDCDIDALAFKIGANASEVHQILKHFFFEHDGKWHHSRCDKEILAFRGKSDKAKNSANARWNNANAMRTHSECNANECLIDANQEPLTTNQEKENTIVASKLTTPQCPHQEIIKLYAKSLPDHPQPRIWEGVRVRDLAARWKWILSNKRQDGTPYATDKESALEFFDRFFAYVAKSDFLTGRAGKWQADLPWLVKAENFAKVISGNYENRG